MDPVVEYPGGYFRAPIVTPPDANGVRHVIMWIGKGNYPFVPDYIEEAIMDGVSKKIPINSDLSNLTPGLSQLMLVHPRAIPQFGYKLRDEWCPTEKQDVHLCIGDLWDLSSAKSNAKHTLKKMYDTEAFLVKTPSVKYVINRAYDTKGEPLNRVKEYKPGVILRFPRFHFEYINQENRIPPAVDKIKGHGFQLEVLKK